LKENLKGPAPAILPWLHPGATYLKII
jgi:hypothetical protein